MKVFNWPPGWSDYQHYVGKIIHSRPTDYVYGIAVGDILQAEQHSWKYVKMIDRGLYEGFLQAEYQTFKELVKEAAFSENI